MTKLQSYKSADSLEMEKARDQLGGPDSAATWGIGYLTGGAMQRGLDSPFQLVGREIAQDT